LPFQRVQLLVLQNSALLSITCMMHDQSLGLGLLVNKIQRLLIIPVIENIKIA